jgi:hypothetical protein
VESTYFLYKATRDPHYLQATFFLFYIENEICGLLLPAGLRQDTVMQTFLTVVPSTFVYRREALCKYGKS